MSWRGIEGHDEVVERFRGMLARDRLASTFLFVGPPGVGKRTFAMQLALTLLCESRPAEAMDPCGQCLGCRMVLAEAGPTHPDLILVSKPPDKASIPVATFIGEREHRMQEGLCADIALKPFRGGRKVAIIDDADALNQEGANCLLKTLEEPPPKSVLILIGTSEHRQLPTIRSRAQIVRFRSLADDVVERLLMPVVEQIKGEPGALIPQIVSRAVSLAEGSVARAVELADPELHSFLDEFLSELSGQRFSTPKLAKSLSDFVDAAGKEGARKRARMKQVVRVTGQFYHRLARHALQAPFMADPWMAKLVERAVGGLASAEAATACLDRCLEAEQQVDANANQATVAECWLDDLDRLATGAMAVTDRPLVAQ